MAREIWSQKVWLLSSTWGHNISENFSMIDIHVKEPDRWMNTTEWFFWFIDRVKAKWRRCMVTCQITLVSTLFATKSVSKSFSKKLLMAWYRERSSSSSIVSRLRIYVENQVVCAIWAYKLVKSRAAPKTPYIITLWLSTDFHDECDGFCRAACAVCRGPLR